MKKSEQIANTITQLGELIDEPFFFADESHRKLKAIFWNRYSEEDHPSMPKLTVEHIAKICDTQRVLQYWKLPGFKQWFLNKHEHRERVEFLYSVSLQALYEILQNTDPKAQSARITAVKLIADLADKMPKKVTAQPTFLDAQIANMSEAELKQFISKSNGPVKRLEKAPDDEDTLDAK